MNEKIRKLTAEAIENEFQELKSCTQGSEEKTAILKNLKELHSMVIEEAKVELAEIERIKEDEFRKQQLIMEAKSRKSSDLLRTGLTVGGWVGTGILVVFAYKFEEFGVVRTAITRTIIPKMFLKNK